MTDHEWLEIRELIYRLLRAIYVEGWDSYLYMAEQTEKWAKVIRLTNIKPE